MAHPITPDEIEDAIEALDAGIGVGDLDDIIEAVQEDIRDGWREFMGEIEDGDLSLVGESEDALVFEDKGKVFWQEELEDVVEYIDLLGADQEMTPEALIAAHHNAAYRLTDHNWATTNPVVVGKPEGFEFGKQYVESLIVSLLFQGLSPGQAWGYFGVEIQGNSRNAWAKRCGYSDHSSVSSAVRKAKDKLSN